MKEISSIPVSLGKLRDLYISMISKFLTCYFFKKSDIVLKVDQRHFSSALRKKTHLYFSTSQEVNTLLKYKPQKTSLNKRVQQSKVEINSI